MCPISIKKKCEPLIIFRLDNKRGQINLSEQNKKHIFYMLEFHVYYYYNGTSKGIQNTLLICMEVYI